MFNIWIVFTYNNHHCVTLVKHEPFIKSASRGEALSVSALFDKLHELQLCRNGEQNVTPSLVILNFGAPKERTRRSGAREFAGNLLVAAGTKQIKTKHRRP